MKSSRRNRFKKIIGYLRDTAEGGFALSIEDPKFNHEKEK